MYVGFTLVVWASLLHDFGLVLFAYALHFVDVCCASSCWTLCLLVMRMVIDSYGNITLDLILNVIDHSYQHQVPPLERGPTWVERLSVTRRKSDVIVIEDKPLGGRRVIVR